MAHAIRKNKVSWSTHICIGTAKTVIQDVGFDLLDPTSSYIARIEPVTLQILLWLGISVISVPGIILVIPIFFFPFLPSAP